MTTKTEAEQRYAMYLAAMSNGVTREEAIHAKAIIHAIFDPLPEPEPVKSLVRIAYDAMGWADWDKTRPDVAAMWERGIDAAITAHEARRPKPTVEEVARAVYEADGSKWSDMRDMTRDAWCRYARAVFPLFGVTP